MAHGQHKILFGNSQQQSRSDGTMFSQRSSESESLHTISDTITRSYLDQCNKHCHDREELLQVIASMLLVAAHQLQDLKFRSKLMEDLQVENLKLKEKIRELRENAKEMQDQLSQLSTYTSSQWTKAVNRAEKRGVIQTEEKRTSTDRVVKTHFTQKLSDFADHCGQEAMKSSQQFTTSFMGAFNFACQYLAEQMEQFFRSKDGKDSEAYKNLSRLGFIKVLQEKVIHWHDSNYWFEVLTAEESKDDHFWYIYEVIMEAKSTMIEQNPQFKEELRERLCDLKAFDELKQHISASTLPQQQSTCKSDPSSTTTSSKTKGISRKSKTKSFDSPDSGTSFQVVPIQCVEDFIKETIEVILMMLCSPNPILPYRGMRKYDSDYVDRVAADVHMTSNQLVGKEIVAYYSPILLTASASGNVIHILDRGQVEVKLPPAKQSF